MVTDNFISWLKHMSNQIVNREGDPVYHCELNVDIGCCHVDGFLCDYPNCSMLKEYKENQQNEYY